MRFGINIEKRHHNKVVSGIEDELRNTLNLMEEKNSVKGL